ncbi:MAG TPA: NAD-dependent epimerase/dehydratase family protein, partial [Gemmatimonadales bacterium]|nr:NAD-dependent epimerase/dehydratase family protein [Gemmatimonadales bacterium]
MPQDASGQPRLHIAITGASGLIGRALATALAGAGHRVTPLVRGTPRPGEVRWDPAGVADLSALGAVDAVVHLAGENIAAGRWTARRRAAILASRRDGTANLVGSLRQLPAPPRTLVAASAIGIYGDRGDERLTESSPTGTGFLADVGRAWEGAADPAANAGIRVVHTRFGIVLTP